MLLYRVFAWDGVSLGGEEGGPLYLPRSRQGSGRHDNPERYGVYYGSLQPVSCVAEAIQAFRGQSLASADLLRAGRRLALASFELEAAGGLADLDDPLQLSRRGWRPSRVAALNRSLTQELSSALFQEGVAGFLWWSILESTWINCTLFGERVDGQLLLQEQPLSLDLDSPELREAATLLGVHLR